jgi:putative aldouronate transport system permease protein
VPMAQVKNIPLGSMGAVRNKKKYTIFTDIARNPVSYLMGLPVIAYTLIFGYFTYPYILMAFQKFNYTTGLLNSPWVGFKNFEFFFRSTQVLTVTLTTIKLNLLFIGFGTVAAVALALMLNELKNKFFLRFTQSLMLFPNYLSWVVVSYMIYSIFATDYGLINGILKAFGMEKVGWYNNGQYWPGILTAMNVWKGAGMSAVIYIATITGIDGTFYEAAELDGANRWQMCWNITLPLMLPTVGILTLLAIGRIMYGDFGMMYAIIGDNGILLSTTDVIDTYVYRALRKIGDPSNAMAVSLFQSLVGFLMVYGSNALVRKYDKGAALF